jgi:DnaJ family protein A protein 5
MTEVSKPPTKIQCHYEVLNVSRDADTATIKKHHRKMALKYHPDKNIGDKSESAHDQFRLVQQAYECLSDPQERKWYDDHREAILAGWSSGMGDNADMKSMLFDVVHYMHAGCYSGYHNEEGGYYYVFGKVFEEIVQCEMQGDTLCELPTNFGDETTEWNQTLSFYQTWESFGSSLNFSWEDKYNAREDADSRKIRRLMEEDNNKARRKAKKVYNVDIIALVAFCKRRDPRVRAKKEEMEQQRLEQETRNRELAAERKKYQALATELWREQAQHEMDAAEEEDRAKGRVRLADLEDNYDYGGGKKRGRKGKKKKKQVEESEDEQEDENDGDGDGEGNANGDDETPKEQDEDGEAGPDSLKEGVDDANVDGEEKEGADPSSQVAADAEEMEEVVDVQAYLQAVDAQPKDVRVVDAQPDVQEEPQEEEEELDDDEEDDESDTESEEEPDFWRCECCRKDFQSKGQMENHMKSKKHKEAYKKYEAKMKKKEMEELMNDLVLDP